MIELVESLAGLPSKRRSLAAREVLFLTGDEIGNLHIVESGEIHLVRHGVAGAALVLQRAGRNGILAEASIFSRTYHCDAVAVVPSIVRAVPVEVVRRRLIDDPALARAWTTHLAKEVQRARLRAEVLVMRTVSERLSAWLSINGGQLPPKGSWKALAAEIGVSPEALYREIGRRRTE
jgi:CRP-like cAMP-binding protein